MTPAELDSLIQNSVRKALSEQASHTQGRTFQSHEYLSIEEASEYLNVPKNTLYGYCHNNVIPFYKRGKFSYFLKSDLDEWMASGRKKSTKEIEQEAIIRLQKGGMKK
ncbi:MAG: helix-turn-helix domain-containing protein [Arcicella sp.]|nr:helix-turn-helix domain-containing protein [Arcicella sp.]